MGRYTGPAAIRVGARFRVEGGFVWRFRLAMDEGWSPVDADGDGWPWGKGERAKPRYKGFMTSPPCWPRAPTITCPIACHVEILNRDERSFKPGSKVKQVGELTI